jgi:branched-chain amino acid transport system substrate-binding protein
MATCAGALLLALVAAACGSGARATSAPAPAVTTPLRTVTLWVDLPLAGAAAEEGRQMLDAVRLVVAQADYRVGNLALRVRASDDADPATGHSDPTRCRAGAARAAADQTAIAVIGTYESSCTMLALPPLGAAGLALISPVNSDPALAPPAATGSEVLVRLAPADALQGTAAAVEAQALGVHRLYILEGRSARAQRLQAALVAGAAANKVAIVGHEPTPPTEAAAAAVLARIGGAGADSIWFGSGAGPGVVAVMRGLLPRTPARSKTPPLVLLGSDALYRDGLVRAAGLAAEGLHLTSEFVPPDGLNGAGADFADAFARQFGQPGLYTAYAADAARLVLAALRRSNGTRAGVLRALFRTRAYNGLIGTLGIDSQGASTLERLGVFRVHNGSFQFERVLDLSKH